MCPPRSGSGRPRLAADIWSHWRCRGGGGHGAGVGTNGAPGLPLRVAGGSAAWQRCRLGGTGEQGCAAGSGLHGPACAHPTLPAPSRHLRPPARARPPALACTSLPTRRLRPPIPACTFTPPTRACLPPDAACTLTLPTPAHPPPAPTLLPCPLLPTEGAPRRLPGVPIPQDHQGRGQRWGSGINRARPPIL